MKNRRQNKRSRHSSPEQGDLFQPSIAKPKTIKEPKLKTASDIDEAVREQTIREKRRKLLNNALKKFRPSKKDYGEVIFVRAHNIPVKGRPLKGEKIVTIKGRKYYPAGQRIDYRSRQQAFIFKVSKSGKMLPYYDWKENKGQFYKVDLKGTKGQRQTVLYKTDKAMPPAPRKPRTADLRVFKSAKINKQFYGKTMGTSTPTTIQTKSKTGGLDFVDKVVPKVAQAIQTEANRNKSGRFFSLECSAQVRGEGVTRTVNFTTSFGQADLQRYMPTGFYEPFVARKLYAEMAEQLKDLKLVTKGSAEYIGKLSWNQGQDKKDWLDTKGMKWKNGRGHLLGEVQLVRFDAIPRLVVIQSK